MDPLQLPLATEDLARRPAFEEALHDLVESGFGELHDDAPVPAPAPRGEAVCWW